MNKKATWIGIVVIILVIVGVSLSKNSKPQSASPIKIGAVISETGVAASFGEMSHKGIALAVKEINAAGGINGRQVEAVYADDGTDPTKAASAFQKLTSVDKVDAIIGSNFDFVTQPLFTLSSTTQTVVVSPSNPRIPGAFDPTGYAFVMMTDFENIVRKFEQFLRATNYKQMGILRFPSSFGESITKTFDAMQQELGKKPLVVETYNTFGNNDFRTQIIKLKKAGVDLLFLDMITNDPVMFVKQAKTLNYNPTLLSHNGFKDAYMLKDVDQSIFNGLVMIDWNVAPEEFVTKFTQEFGTEPDKSANRAYDAVYVLANAIAKAKNKQDVPNVLINERFTTPNGPFSFTANHAAANTEASILIVEKGKLVPWKK